MRTKKERKKERKENKKDDKIQLFWQSVSQLLRTQRCVSECFCELLGGIN